MARLPRKPAAERRGLPCLVLLITMVALAFAMAMVSRGAGGQPSRLVDRGAAVLSGPGPSGRVGETAPEPGSLDKALADAPSCPELSNGCAVCKRNPDGKADCSTPGIACQPTGWACQLPAK